MAEYSRTELYGVTEVHYLENKFKKLIGVGAKGDNIKYEYNYCLPQQVNGSYMFLVRKKKKFGLLGASGKVLIPCTFDKMTEISDGIAVVQEGRKIGAVDYNGYVLVEPNYKEVTYEDGVLQCRDKSGNWTFKQLVGRQAKDITIDNGKIVESATHMFKIEHQCAISSDNFISENNDLDKDYIFFNPDRAKLYIQIQLIRAQHRLGAYQGLNNYFIRESGLTLAPNAYQNALIKEKRNFKELLEEIRPEKTRSAVISYVAKNKLDAFLGEIAAKMQQEKKVDKNTTTKNTTSKKSTTEKVDTNKKVDNKSSKVQNKEEGLGM